MLCINKNVRFKCLNILRRKYLHIPVLTLTTNKTKHYGSKIFTQTVKDGEYSVTKNLQIPAHINVPPYAKTGIVENSEKWYEIKDEEYIKKMKKAGKLAARCLKLCLENSKDNITTDEIDKLAFNFIIEHNAYPAGINFHGFPKTICASPNEVVCHGIPNLRKLRSGDIVTYDCTVFVDGVFGDCAGTKTIGDVSKEHKKLVEVSKECLYKAISICRDGQKFSEIGRVITEHAEKYGFHVIKDFCGHFIGTNMHMYPLIEHYFPNTHGNTCMKEGQIFTIEPILSEGSVQLKCWNDKWTFVTIDHAFCSQWEHTILILKDGAQILTLADD